MPIITETYLKGQKLPTDITNTFANNAAANTQFTNTVLRSTLPSVNAVGEYGIIVYNPSAITDLTIKLFNINLNVGGATRDSLITTITVPKSQVITGTTVNTRTTFVHGLFCGGDIKIVVSNDTVLGAADTFAYALRIEEVN